MEYVIIEGNGKSKLMERVNARLADGWELVGGVSVIWMGAGQVQLFQALQRATAEEAENFTIAVDAESAHNWVSLSDSDALSPHATTPIIDPPTRLLDDLDATDGARELAIQELGEAADRELWDLQLKLGRRIVKNDVRQMLEERNAH